MIEENEPTNQAVAIAMDAEVKAFEGFRTSLWGFAAAAAFYVLVYLFGYSTLSTVMIHAAAWIATGASAVFHLGKRQAAAEIRTQLTDALPTGVRSASLAHCN